MEDEKKNGMYFCDHLFGSDSGCVRLKNGKEYGRKLYG